MTITNGRCRRRKGKVIGGGHGFYVVNWWDQTTLLKTESQLVATTTEIPAPVKQSKIVEDTSEGSEAEKEQAVVKAKVPAAAVASSANTTGVAAAKTNKEQSASEASSTTQQKSSNRDRSKKKTSRKSSDAAAVPNAAASRPRRANAGINKARTDPKYGSVTANKYSRRYNNTADGGDDSVDSDSARTGPMTPAEKFAHRNKEKSRLNSVLSKCSLEAIKKVYRVRATRR